MTTVMRHQGQADGGTNCSRPRRNPDQTVHVSTCKSLINSCKIIVYTWEGWAEKRGTQTHQRPYIGLLALVISCWTSPFDFLDGSLMATCVFRLVPGLGFALPPSCYNKGFSITTAPLPPSHLDSIPPMGHTVRVCFYMEWNFYHHQVGKH